MQRIPHFLQTPLSVQCLLGQTVELSCSFDGHPPPNCFWYREAKRLNNSDDKNLNIIGDSQSSNLTIQNINEAYLGEYLCTIRNAYGEDLATASVMLEGY